MNQTTISSADDLIDSRDLIAAIAEVENDLTDAQHAQDIADLTEDLAKLKELLADVENASGEQAKHGVTLIADGHFEDYARQLAEDIGAIESDGPWPTNFINWERAANALKMDYSTVEFEGMTYWVRA